MTELTLEQIQTAVLLTPKKIEAAVRLALGQTGIEVALYVDVTPETISHWKKEPEFQAYLNELKLEAMESSREALRELSGKAVQGLEELITSAKSENVKLRACTIVLELTGVNDPETWGWGIGPTDPSAIEWRNELERSRLLQKLMG